MERGHRCEKQVTRAKQCGTLGVRAIHSVPIDTLMIANLSLGTNEGDVQTVMYGFPGYKRSKLVNNGKSCTAWVQFEDIPCAEAAMRTLQGSSTLALDAQGLRIAFSKNPMGVTSSRASS